MDILVKVLLLGKAKMRNMGLMLHKGLCMRYCRIKTTQKYSWMDDVMLIYSLVFAVRTSRIFILVSLLLIENFTTSLC